MNVPIPFGASECAHCVPIEDEIKRRGIELKRQGAELVGPCPVCGGRDRFGVNTRKQVWNCRKCNVGGDVIALARHVDGCNFVTAVVTLGGDAARKKAAPQPKRHTKAEDENGASMAAWHWSGRNPITEGTPPWLYLRKRGYTGPFPATFGYLPPRDPYPAALIAAFGMADELEPEIIGVPKSVIGVHLTRLTAGGDKAPNADGKSKIMRGVCMGTPVTLSPPNDLLGLAVTEGLEDGLSVTNLLAWEFGRPARPCSCRRLRRLFLTTSKQ